MAIKKPTKENEKIRKALCILPLIICCFLALCLAHYIPQDEEIQTLSINLDAVPEVAEIDFLVTEHEVKEAAVVIGSIATVEELPIETPVIREIDIENLLWPLPAKIINETPHLYLPIANLALGLIESSNQEIHSLIAETFNKTISSISNKCTFNPATTEILINISITSEAFSPVDLVDIDEFYALSVKESGITIKASSHVGATYALQTLSQMFLANEESCLVALADIEDVPRFPYRGIMLDTARNFFSVDDIKRQMEAMAASKLNVFHWHIYDAQSFPIAWDFDNGKMFKAEAYKTSQEDNISGTLKVYTEDDIKDLVNFALRRGIRVIPEFDMPGHTTVFASQDPSIVKCANFGPFDGGKGPQNFITRRCNQPPCGQLDPDNEKTYQVVAQFLDDMSVLFPDPIQHLGMDEVNPMCWDKSTNNEIVPQMQKFASRVIDIQKKNGKKFMGWDEVINSYNLSSSEALGGGNILPADSYIQVWEAYNVGNINASQMGFKFNGLNAIQNMGNIAADLDYKVIMTPNSAWYLDCGPQVYWCANRDSSRNAIWHDFNKMYDYNPTKDITKRENIKGGVAAAWSESIKLSTLDFVIWPRAAAVAERLWSPESTVRDDSTLVRVERFRAALINEIGISPAEVTDTVGKAPFFFRPEWCDFNLYSESQKSSDIYPGMEKSTSIENSNYCEPASKYATEQLIRSKAGKVAYPF